jgi:hypothetical protein
MGHLLRSKLHERCLDASLWCIAFLLQVQHAVMLDLP